MMRLSCGGLLTILWVLASGPAVAASPQGYWVWAAETSSSSETDASTSASATLFREFELPGDVVSARLRVGASSAAVRILIDGDAVALMEPFDPMLDVRLQRHLRRGEHRIDLITRSATGPSAVFVRLDVLYEDGTTDTLVSDAQWRSVATSAEAKATSQIGSGAPVIVRSEVESGLIVPADHEVVIRPTDNYEQWKQAIDAEEGTDPATFWTVPDFEIERLRSAGDDEGSWISLVFDREGRLLIGKEERGLLRLTFSEGDAVDRVEHLAPTLRECRGLAFLGDVLYANANESKGLYRLTPQPGGNGFGKPELVFASQGGTGHGRNDLVAGPDNHLYSIHGDAVELPQGQQITDWTSPFRDARRGQATREGALLKIDPDTGDAQLLVAGLRNPFGIDMNRHGELFTYDADAEFDMGAPWYRPTRVQHLLPGADYGWRGVTGDWPPYYPDHPDNARPGLTIGKGSPTSVKFAYGSRFPAPYRDALFILDWAYGRVIAVHMVPHGSSYLMSAETFLKGRPLNVTDLAFGPEGDLYLVTGGRKTQSALYRVRFRDSTTVSQQRAATGQPNRFAQRRDDFASDAREQRRALESALTKAPSRSTMQLSWSHLDSEDPWIRQAAARLLERQPLERWQSRTLAEENPRRAVMALLSLARAPDASVTTAIIGRLNEILPGLESDSDRLLAFYTYWLCMEREDPLPEPLRQSTVETLDRFFPSPALPAQAEQHNRWLSRVMLKLQAPGAIEQTVALLRGASSQREQMHYLYVLRNARGDWTLPQRRTFFEALQQARGYLSGAGMPGFLEQIRKEALAHVSEKDRARLGDLILAPQDGFHHDHDAKPRPIVRDWRVEDFVNGSHKTDLPESANLERGAEVFAQAACIRCHRFGSRGTLLGPDLTSVNRRFRREDLLASILEPSSVIADNYRSLQVVTDEGRVLVGQATSAGDYRSPSLRLATDPADPSRIVEIPKSAIVQQRYSDVSWMPDGLMDTFTHDEVMDLVAYLLAGPSSETGSSSESQVP